MKPSERAEHIIQMGVLACYESLVGPLPQNMLSSILATLKGRRFETAEELKNALQLAAVAYVELRRPVGLLPKVAELAPLGE